MLLDLVFIEHNNVSALCVRIFSFLLKGLLQKRREADAGLLSVLVVHELEHHFNVLAHSFVRSVLASAINHALWHVVNHLEICFHLLVGSWIHVWFYHELVALFATLFSLCMKVEWSWI
jgi:hypothetical protein